MQNLDLNIESELNGLFTVCVVFHDDHVRFFENITEIHCLYPSEMKAPHNRRIALESDVEGRGDTLNLNDIREVAYKIYA